MKIGQVFTPGDRAREAASMLKDACDDAGMSAPTVWDPCCGEGALMRAVKLMMPRSPVVGTDIDADCVVAARKEGLSASVGDLFEIEKSMGDALIVNPPYLGRAKLQSVLGKERVRWLKERYPAEGAGGADLAAYVLRHCLEVFKPAVSVWIVTNTIAQGGCRRVGLQWALRNGYRIPACSGDVKWGEGAGVTVKMFVAVRYV